MFRILFMGAALALCLSGGASAQVTEGYDLGDISDAPLPEVVATRRQAYLLERVEDYVMEEATGTTVFKFIGGCMLASNVASVPTGGGGEVQAIEALGKTNHEFWFPLHQVVLSRNVRQAMSGVSSDEDLLALLSGGLLGLGMDDPISEGQNQKRALGASAQSVYDECDSVRRRIDYSGKEPPAQAPKIVPQISVPAPSIPAPSSELPK